MLGFALRQVPQLHYLRMLALVEFFSHEWKLITFSFHEKSVPEIELQRSRRVAFRAFTGEGFNHAVTLLLQVRKHEIKQVFPDTLSSQLSVRDIQACEKHRIVTGRFSIICL